MICRSCGTEASVEARFCTECGAAQELPANDATIADEFLGSVIENKYRIDSWLGQGGMARVYKATRLQIGDTVAIKILLEDRLSDSQAVERFRREASAAARLKHANAVVVHDFGVTGGGVAYLVMELVEGQTLRRLIQDRRSLPVSVAVDIAIQVCAALEAAHREHIVHRDIKPDNIMVAPRPEALRVKVLDFGIARVRDLSAVGALTATGLFVGTPQYMSPEQWRGEEIDHRSDIYSLGVVLYEMLAGVTPFNSSSLSGLFTEHIGSAPASLCALNASVPPAMDQVVMRALAKFPDERPQTATALAQELEAAGRTGTGRVAAVAQSDSGGFTSRITPGNPQPTTLMPAPQRTSADRVQLGSPASRTARFKTPLAVSALIGALLAASAGVGWLVTRSGSAAPPEPAAGLIVRTLPASSVVVDARFVGTTDAAGSLNVIGLEPGRHIITIQKDGYRSSERTVVLEQHRSDVVQFQLQLIATPLSKVQPPAPAPVADTTTPETAISAPVPGPPVPPADPCAGRTLRCQSAGPVAAEVLALTASVPTNMTSIHILQARVRFSNGGQEPVVLGYVRDTAAITDENGARYALRFGGGPFESVRGLGLVRSGDADPRFRLAPGASGDATFTLARARERNTPLGSTFQFDVTVAMLEALSGGGVRTLREYPLGFTALAAPSVGSRVAATADTVVAPDRPACGVNSQCHDAGPFVAELTSLTPSFPLNVTTIHLIQARVRFRNVTDHDVVLAYVSESASAVDELGHRYMLRSGATYESVNGLGMLTPYKVDPQFVLHAGGSGNVTLMLARSRVGNDDIGTAFSLDFTVAALDVQPNRQPQPDREYPITLTNVKATGPRP